MQIEKARIAAEISLSQQKSRLAEQALIDQAEMQKKRVQHETTLADLHARNEAAVELEERKLEMERTRNEAAVELEERRFEVERARNEEQLRVLRETALAEARAKGGAEMDVEVKKMQMEAQRLEVRGGHVEHLREALLQHADSF